MLTKHIISLLFLALSVRQYCLDSKEYVHPHAAWTCTLVAFMALTPSCCTLDCSHMADDMTDILPISCKRLPFRFRVKWNLVMLKVYRSDTTATRFYTETPVVPASALFFNLGGSFGLCIGFSVITLTEILHFLLSICVSAWKARENRITEEKN